MFGAKVISSTFHPSKVMASINPKKKRFLFRFGAFVMTGSRRSLKSGGKKNRSSVAGKPPRIHSKALKRNIFFAVDLIREDVVIGPVVLSRDAGARGMEALETGGKIHFDAGGKKRTSRIRARPFMFPSFAKESAQISTIWRGANPT